ncbi:hypothetical protein GCM10023169_17540 [Georgenia halophila]|uniref:Uncharacterized protein n=1 Tax=Georgenia halophila TaxID=620889 RepID=A0ABP8L703_9MICO
MPLTKKETVMCYDRYDMELWVRREREHAARETGKEKPATRAEVPTEAPDEVPPQMFLEQLEPTR